MAREVSELLQKDAISVVQPYGARDGFYSTYFIVPKKSGGLRPILNLKIFNRCLRKVRFKMETLNTIASVVPPGCWMASIDLKDAYFHVSILRSHRRFLRFRWKGQAFQFRAMPFGLSSAPRVFTKLLQPLMAFLRTRGISVYVYLDDILVTAPSPLLANQAVRETAQVLLHAGFIINLSKSELSPTQDITYIGGRFRTDLGMIFLPPARQEALQACVRTFLMVGQYKPAHQFLRLLGLMAACLSVVKLARLFMRPVQWHVKNRWSPTLGLQARIMVTLSLVADLQWWLSISNLQQGLRLQPPLPQLTVTTDASLQGWGGYLHGGQNILLQGVWSPPERSLHINILELRAIRLTLQGLEGNLVSKSVLLESDNASTVAYVNKQGGIHSHSLYQEARLLYSWLIPRNITVLAVHRPGIDNTLADSLSRDVADSREWSLDQRVVDHLFRLWGPPTLDLFATGRNTKLPQFCSRIPETGSMGEAFSMSWTLRETYAFPPLPLIPRVLSKLRQERASMTLIAPLWPRRLWFPLLLQLSCDSPRRLPPSPQLLSQSLPNQGILFNQDVLTLRLTAWRLSGDSSKTEAFQQKLLASCSHPADPPPAGFTTPAGRLSVAGAVKGISIPLLPL
jgi:hypothetical protein